MEWKAGQCGRRGGSLDSGLVVSGWTPGRGPGIVPGMNPVIAKIISPVTGFAQRTLAGKIKGAVATFVACVLTFTAASPLVKETGLAEAFSGAVAEYSVSVANNQFEALQAEFVAQGDAMTEAQAERVKAVLIEQARKVDTAKISSLVQMVLSGFVAAIFMAVSNSYLAGGNAGLQLLLNRWFGANLKVDADPGPVTKAELKDAIKNGPNIPAEPPIVEKKPAAKHPGRGHRPGGKPGG